MLFIFNGRNKVLDFALMGSRTVLITLQRFTETSKYRVEGCA